MGTRVDSDLWHLREALDAIEEIIAAHGVGDEFGVGGLARDIRVRIVRLTEAIEEGRL